MTREVRPPTPAQFAAARTAIAANLTPTPTVPLHTALGTLWCKLESLQPGGSFKVRGAVAAVSAAVAERPDVQVVTCSAGNHGLGVAYAAQLLSVPATVVLSTTASAVKVARLKGYDIELVQQGESFADAQAFALSLAAERDARYISPYNDADVIAGQSTVATELLEQLPDVAHLLIPVGGGGLLSGVGLVLRDAGRHVQLLGLQPARDAAMVASLHEGHAVDIERGQTIADGLAGAIEEGSVTIDVITELGIHVETLEEPQIRAAVRTAAVDYGLVMEGSAAIALAAAELGMVPFDDGPVAMIATGRNITASLLAELIEASE
jgi:threonine dehydratase